jgi:toxin ParE1/3/4
MKVRFTPSATRHLAAIAQYLTERNPDAARRVGERIREVIELLADFPEIGHLGTLRATREIVIPGLPYIIVYRSEPERDALVILGVYHGAQLRPGQQDPNI